MKIKLLLVLLFMSVGVQAQLCIDTNTASGGDDNDPVVVSFSTFTCAQGQPLTSLSLTTTNTSSNCNSWYSYIISVTHAGGTETTSGNCNVTDLDIATFNGASINLNTVTDISITSFDDDNYAAGDSVTINASLQIGFVPPSCPLPTALTSLTITESSADLSWTAGGTEVLWDVEYGSAGFTLGSGTLVNDTTNNPYSVSGLSPNTTYDFYVKAKCSPTEESSWVGPFSFTTKCALFNIPFSENFDSSTTGSSSNTNAPNCWSFIDSGSGFVYVYDNSATNVQSGAKSYRFYNGLDSSGDYMLISPEIAELTTDGVQVQFSAKGANGQELELGTITDPNDASTFTVLATTTLTSTSFEDIEINIPTSTDSYFAVRHGQTGTYDSYYLDDFNFVGGLPNCIKPTSLNATGITATSADLTWTSGGSGETLWDIEYGADGFTQGTETIVVANSNPYTLSTFTESTDYDYYVRANCGGGDYSEWVGPFSFSTPASCLVPTALDAVNITSSSADLSWTSGGSGESSWEVEYGVDGFTQGSGTTITPATNPVSAIGLMSNTDYDYYVRANCGAGDFSEWSGPYSFETACAAEIPDYLEDFASYIPQCWEEGIDGDPVNGPTSLGSSLWTAEEFAHIATSGTGAVDLNIYLTGDIEWLLSPSFDLSAGGYELNLDVAFTNYNATTQGVFDADDDVRVLYTLDGVTWVTIVQWNSTNANAPPAAAGGETFNFDLSAITGSNVRFAIYSDEGSTATGDKDFHIDNFQIRTIPACQEPTALTASNITTSSADLAWTVSGSGESLWDIEYGTTGFTLGNGTLVDNTANNPYSLTGLSSGVIYDYYVRAHCGTVNESAWAGPVTFRIPNLGDSCDTPIVLNLEADCTTATPPYDLDYNSSIDLGTTSFSCDTSGINDGAWFEFTANSRESIDINVSIATEYALYSDCNTELLCGAIATGGFLITGLVDGETYKLALWKDGNQSTINQICIQEGPTCVQPFNLNSMNVNDVSVELDWDANNGETAWELEYGIDGFTQGTGTIVQANSNPYTLTGLSSSTDYDVYVRAVCSPIDYSEWSVVDSFTTACGPITNYPIITDMTSNVPNPCWSESGSGEIVDGPSGTSSDWRSGRSYTNSSNNIIGSNAINLFSDNDREWLVTEEFDLSSGSLELQIQVALTDWTSSGISDATDTASMGSDDQVDLLITTDNGGTWLSIDNWNTTNEPSVTGSDYNYDLSSYTGVVRFAFFASDGSTDDSEDYDFHIGKFEIQVLNTDYIWNGTTWNNTPEGNITSNDNMIVQAGTMPSLTSAISVGNLTLEAGAALEADNGDITVVGNLENNGSFTGVSQVILSSSTASVTGAGSMTNLTVDATGDVTMNGMQSISEQLDVVSGGQLDANGNITLVSNAMGTARVDAVEAGAITGNVNVERYIPAGNRAYRFIGSTVSGPSIYDSWQEAGVNATGFGVQITGTAGTAGTVNATTGHDETTTGNASMFKWDASNQSWTTVTNTKTEILNAGDYYRLFVRGDRMTDLAAATSPAHTETTLRASGSLMTGSMTVTPGIASGEFFAFANPYQSKLSTESIVATGVGADMYYWDPALGEFGGYSAIPYASTSGTVGSAGVATNVLDAGQAVFFVDNGGSASVAIAESNKVAGTTNGGVFNVAPLQQALRLKIYQTSRFNNGQTESDGLYLDFNAAHNINVDSNDAVKLNGLNVNMAIAKSTGELLTVERRSLPSVNESLELNITNYLTTAYTINATVDVLPGLTAYLKDNFTDTMTELVQGMSTAVDFTVDMNNAQSLDALRFELVFQVVTLSNEDVNFGSNLSIYPNPVKGDTITINIGDASVEKAQVQVFNALGQQVMSNDYNNLSNGVIELNNLSDLSNGVYIINISSGDATTTRRFIKE
nr:fibronectin type III domain-containing protein [Nonlabens ulvanivorans]